MYRILADFDATGDWETLWYQGDEDFTASDVSCRLEMGEAGELELSVHRTNPQHGRSRTRKTLLDFQKNGKSLGIFEVREIGHDMYGSEALYSVGELDWLRDSVQPQAEYHDLTARQFITKLLSVHNAQCTDHRFSVGIVDVTDSNDSLYRFTNREQTLDAIRDKLVDRLGGNLRVRRVGATRYLDYVSDQTYGSEAEQTIRFGENILDYTDNFEASDICTEVVPLGARLENDKGDNSTIGNLEKRVTIESVAGGAGHDWISDSNLVARFGRIRTTQTWDDVTVPTNLLAKARAWLTTEQFERMHITVKAVDLSMSDSQFGELRMGDRAYVICDHMGLKKSFPIRVRTYNPDAPEQDTVELGDVARSTFTATQARSLGRSERKASEHERIQAQWLTDAIENVTAMMTGNRGGYKLTEYDEEGRWLADYIMDSMDKSTAKVVKKVTVDGTAYSRTGINGPYDTAIMANGMILGKYIVAHSIQAEQISQSYTSQWQSADSATLNTARSEFQAGDAQISARVTQVQEQANGLRTDLAAEIKVRADQISTKVTKGQINSTIKQTAETIFIESNHFGWQSTYSSMTTDGTLTAKNAKFVNCDVSGKVTATTGAIGGYTIAANKIYNDSVSLEKDGIWIKNSKTNIGMIGTNNIKGYPKQKGLVFDLESNGTYMAWCSRDNSDDDSYSIKMLYARRTAGNGSTAYKSGRLSFSCDTDFRNNKSYNMQIDTATGGAAGGVSGNITINGYTMVFKRGFLVDTRA